MNGVFSVVGGKGGLIDKSRPPWDEDMTKLEKKLMRGRNGSLIKTKTEKRLKKDRIRRQRRHGDGKGSSFLFDSDSN